MTYANLKLDIKKICLLAGFDQPFQSKHTIGGQTQIITKLKYEKVGMHTARRSFATNAYLAGMDNVIIMRVTGHKKEKNLLGYICVTDEQHVDGMLDHPFYQE